MIIPDGPKSVAVGFKYNFEKLLTDFHDVCHPAWAMNA